MTVNTARAREAASDPMLLATDLADYLVRRGVPFRKAHELVGKAVAMSISTGTPLNKLSDEQFASISNAYGTDARDVFELTKAFAQRTNPGAPNSDNTRRRIAYWEGILPSNAACGGGRERREPAVRLRGAPPGAGRGRFNPAGGGHNRSRPTIPAAMFKPALLSSLKLIPNKPFWRTFCGTDRRCSSHSAGHGLCHRMRTLPNPGPHHRHCGRVPHLPVQRKQISNRRPHRSLRDHHHGRPGAIPRIRPAGLHIDGGPLPHHLWVLPHGGAHPLYSIPCHHRVHLRHRRGNLFHAN